MHKIIKRLLYCEKHTSDSCCCGESGISPMLQTGVAIVIRARAIIITATCSVMFTWLKLTPYDVAT